MSTSAAFARFSGPFYPWQALRVIERFTVYANYGECSTERYQGQDDGRHNPFMYVVYA